MSLYPIVYSGNVLRFSAVDEHVITRRTAVLAGIGFAAGSAATPVRAFESKGFWNAKEPSDWTASEVQQLLNNSPWAKSASISYYGGQNGPLGSSSRPAGRRGARVAGGGAGGTAGNTSSQVKWKAIVRWESALPVREALKNAANQDFGANYILNLIGDLPGVAIGSGSDDEQRSALQILQDTTALEHQGDQINLTRVEPAPKTALSEAGTLFYFSRLLALRLGDKQVTFMTKIGPIDVKCKFTLKDMVYRGNLEL